MQILLRTDERKLKVIFSLKHRQFERRRELLLT